MHMDMVNKNEHIRIAVPGDAQEILNIYAPYITDTCISFETEVPTVEKFTERIISTIAEYPYLVYYLDNRIVGYAYASRYRERAAYKYSANVSVYVATEHHRHGIGKALYEKLFELLRSQSVYTIYAGITQPNEASMGLHKSLGFTEVGTYHNVGYKHGKWLDVTWLEKQLRDYDDPEKSDTGVSVRLAVPADALELAEVHMRSWEAAYKGIIPDDFIREKNAKRSEQWKEIITDVNSTRYTIRQDSIIVGLMCLDQAGDDDLNSDVYELQAIYLHPDHFRQGIGTIAMRFAFDKARSLGKTAIVLWVLADNTDSISFYEKCGFAADGKAKDLEYGRILKGIRMRRTL